MADEAPGSKTEPDSEPGSDTESDSDPSSDDPEDRGRQTGGASEDEGITWLDIKLTLAGGAVVAAVLFLAVFIVGEAGSAEARILLEAAFPAIRFLSSSVLTVGATVLALMLTLLGFTQSRELDFSQVLYSRIRLLSLMNVVAIICAVSLLLFMEVPLQESETLRGAYQIIYYGFLALSSLLGGLTVAIVLMLHRTIVGLITAISPGERTGHLIQDDRT